ncbi:glycosyltransferase family 2 protein [Caldichromatium japonicum]|uniref:Glycosyltransferase family 2 protein n=1 Tax=Caldichromatium japonicum TaxID=2699430 RepID=A0A6G7VDK1_9GAMM|nr:glycosyltransferase family 2 protein [Caldichromatium japonicum]QIK38032.1 glycosyltransferase family 2 protein [Caldichromatium japonicum]
MSVHTLHLAYPPELAIIIPTYQEAESVAEIAKWVAAALDGVAWELIFVDDDSPDGTAERVRALARRDPRIRVLQRIGRRGLASACIEGMLATSAPYLAVMDADLQHDAQLLPQMLHSLRHEGLDLVIGSRYLPGGDLGNWDRRRRRMSRLATRIAQIMLHAELTDPMSGFFMIRAEVLHRVVRRLSGLGFKILLDLFSAADAPLRFRELPYRFRARQQGESKLDNAVLWEFLLMLIQKLTGAWVPIRFIAFSLIGGIGVVVHLAVLWSILELFGLPAFAAGQATAALVAMTSNFFLNNLLTYRDLRLRGRALIRGWLSFVFACSIGALANVGIANYLFQETRSGWVLSALAGILVGAVWNYAVTAVYTWRRTVNAL